MDGRLKTIFFPLRTIKKENKKSCKKLDKDIEFNIVKSPIKFIIDASNLHVLKYSFELINIILGAFIQ